MSIGYSKKRVIRLHIGWPKSGSTTLQKHVFDRVKGHRYLGKVPFNYEKEVIFFNLAYLISYASQEKFETMHHGLFSDLKRLEIGLFGDVDESVPAILSDEAFLSTLLKPSVHQHHGFSTASLSQIIERFALLEDLWNVSFDILIVERDPIQLLHAYYAQMFHIISAIGGLETWKKYIEVGLTDHHGKDLGFRFLRPGVVSKAFIEKFGADRVFVIPMSELFSAGSVRLGAWHPAFEDVISGPGERENSRSVGKDVKVAHYRPIWVEKKPFKLKPFLKDVKAMYMARHSTHDKLEVLVKIRPEDINRLGKYLSDDALDNP